MKLIIPAEFILLDARKKMKYKATLSNNLFVITISFQEIFMIYFNEKPPAVYYHFWSRSHPVLSA